MRYFIGMDVGGTHCRMKVGDGSGRILGEFDGPGCSLNTDSEAVCRDRYRGLVLPALKKLGLTPEACGGLCAAASGLDFPAQAAAVAGYLKRWDLQERRCAWSMTAKFFSVFPMGPP